MNLANLKICGITARETACLCAEKGVGALGAIFYKKSPRYVSPRRARELFDGLPKPLVRVGVFFDMPTDELIATALEAALDTVQLHGSETAEAILTLQQAGFHVIKTLKVTGGRLLKAAHALPQNAGILVECGHGTLPGGNGATWNWAEAAPLAEVRPFALAGGLAPANILEAARLSHASAWDVSSGVEHEPGIKDPAAIVSLVKTLAKLCGPEVPSSPPLRFWALPFEGHRTATASQ